MGRGVALELDRNEPGAAICEVGDVERRLDVDRALQRGRDGVERAELRAGSARSLARQGIRPGRRRRRNAAARLVRRGLLCGIDGRRPPRLDVAAVAQEPEQRLVGEDEQHAQDDGGDRLAIELLVHHGTGS